MDSYKEMLENGSVRLPSAFVAMNARSRERNSLLGPTQGTENLLVVPLVLDASMKMPICENFLFPFMCVCVCDANRWLTYEAIHDDDSYNLSVVPGLAVLVLLVFIQPCAGVGLRWCRAYLC